jgi:hypothetical protein
MNQYSDKPKEEQEALVAEELTALEKERENRTRMPGVIPGTSKYLDHSDPDGNQLWRVVCLKQYAVEYIKVLKRAGFVS